MVVTSYSSRAALTAGRAGHTPVEARVLPGVDDHVLDRRDLREIADDDFRGTEAFAPHSLVPHFGQGL